MHIKVLLGIVTSFICWEQFQMPPPHDQQPKFDAHLNFVGPPANYTKFGENTASNG